MKCPFLRETRVKYCESSAWRKLIVEDASDVASERCSSPAYPDCPAAAARLQEGQFGAPHCPFLHEMEVEYCGAASVTKYIPSSDALLSRCSTDGHQYCELYLTRADPEGARLLEPTEGGQGDGSRGASQAGIPLPSHLAYAPNHMWLDLAGDGCCHIGVDAFLARTLGSVDAISFIAGRGFARPVAVLTVNGVDLHLVFPNPIHCIATNSFLRTAPTRLTVDPYGGGWLFEGDESSAQRDRAEVLLHGLIDGESAIGWIRAESERLAGFVHEISSRPPGGESRLMADGGCAEGPVAHSLDHEDLISLYNEFFAPQRAWRRVS